MFRGETNCVAGDASHTPSSCQRRMALSRRDALLAGIGAFIAWGFAVSWLPVLRFIGYAFVSGVALSVFTLLFLVFTTSKFRRKGDYDSNPAPSTVSFLHPGSWNAEAVAFRESRTYQSSRLYPPSFVISDALDGLLELALRDFVSSWYGSISKGSAFVNEVDREIRTAIENIRNRLLQEDIVNVAVSRLVPIFTSHLKEFDLAERAVRGRALNRNITESEELDLAIAAKYKDGKLHPAASLSYSDPKVSQQEYLRKMLVRILPEVLPQSSLKSPSVSVLIKEIVACAVLYPVMQMLSDPDTWNQLIEAYGRAALQDRKTVRKLRAALDEHASPDPTSKQAAAFPRLKSGDSERAFERFVKAIRRCNNLPDARQFRMQVASQLKRESEVENRDQIYLRRLETGKRVLDQKVTKLLFKAGNTSATMTQPDFRNGSTTQSRDASLVEVLHSAAGLSYFMEYMDRQSMMSLVQFWIVVDGFRDPLEDDFGEDDVTPGLASWNETSRADIAQINEAYLSKSELKVPDESRIAVKDFLSAKRNATALQYRQARTAILTAQSLVLEEMEKRYFPAFKKSDLYYKYLTSDEASSTITTQVEAKDHALSPELPSSVIRLRPPPLARTTSQPAERTKNLRRAVASTTDIKNSSKLFDDSDLPRTSLERRSIDTDRSAPLFDDDYDTDPLANSTHSLGRDSASAEAANQERVMENMEAALNTIITEDPKDEKSEDLRESLFGSPTSSLGQKQGKLFDSPSDSLEQVPAEAPTYNKVRPSIASLGLVNAAGRIGVFTDDDLFPDEEKFIEDEYIDQHDSVREDSIDDEIHEAAPGDLGLSEAIANLTTDLDKLVSQEAVVDALTRKAELTNNSAELRILGKSKSSIQREMRRKELQRQQYILQESDNSLYGRAHVRIKSIMVGREDDGRQFALYLLEIQRRAGDAMPAASWAVARRYSEFLELHTHLRARYQSVRNHEFPRRRMVMKLQKEFLHKRRIALEHYMQQLLLLPEVCRSLELRSFLSQQAILPISNGETASPIDSASQDIVSRIYNSVTDGMDDFLGNIAVLDQLSAAGQSLISAATSQLNTNTSTIAPTSNGTATPNGLSSFTDATQSAEAEAELNAYTSPESDAATALEPFVKPIADLFLETFELNRGNNWLRGRAVVLVLHQLLGGTIERRVRDAAKTFLAEDAVLKYIALAKETMWPSGGKMREAKVRTAAEKQKTRQEASFTLAALMPELVGSVVGRANAQSAARRVASCLNNGKLGVQVAYVVLDEVVSVLFGDDRIKR